MGIAYDNGINFFDNAEVYALGESEKMMGRVLKRKQWDRTSYTVSLGATRDAQLIENLKALPALTLDVMEEIDVIMGNTPVMDEY